MPTETTDADLVEMLRAAYPEQTEEVRRTVLKDCPHFFNRILTWANARRDEAVGEMQKERDEAQSACSAWRDVFLSIEAHIQDRMAMRDPASPSSYLEIIRGDVADVNRSSQQIVAARWADYKRQTDAITTRDAQIARLK
jgi:hypothetical protein